MKSDRLYAITLHLLNHGKTSAAELAERFEVSVRTVQRDIDALCAAGIPVAALSGADGGYYLPDDFVMSAHTATQEDYSHILTALRGYSTAIRETGIASALEKISALTDEKDSGIILDFSVLREIDDNVMSTLKEAIKLRRAVCFSYTNAENITREHTVEPIALMYRWYAWYLLAYSLRNDDYRTYKLVRMNSPVITCADFTKAHASVDEILEHSGASERKTTRIKALCRPEARAKAIEYLNAQVTAEHENGECEMIFHVIESEHLWFGTLLSLGDAVRIIEPGHIRERIRTAAEKILSLYQ